MQLRAKTFWIQKAGNSTAEYEDASWPRTPLNDCQSSPSRFAVADGATESSYAGIWATQLVRAFCKGLLDSHTIRDRLPTLQQQWSKIVDKRVTAHGRPLPWYAEEKIREGAFAAILGLKISTDVLRDTGGTWQASALGDICLVHMRGEQILSRFPLDSSGSFTNRPQLLSSNPAHNNSLPKHLPTIERTWERGDVFYLMTDALACWFMKEVEAGQTPWTFLREFELNSSTDFFRDWVGELRALKVMRNDDVTLLRVNVLS